MKHKQPTRNSGLIREKKNDYLVVAKFKCLSPYFRRYWDGSIREKSPQFVKVFTLYQSAPVLAATHLVALRNNEKSKHHWKEWL